jgi:hypothetical protein
LTPCCGFEVRKPTQAFKSVKDLGNIFDLIPKWQELCRPWYIFHEIFIILTYLPATTIVYTFPFRFCLFFQKTYCYIFLMFYNYTIFRLMRCLHVNRNLTHQYGISGNDVIICRVGNIPEHGTSLHIKVDIWHPAVSLRCGNPPRYLNKLKTRAYLWLTNNPYIFTCNYHCLYLSI